MATPWAKAYTRIRQQQPLLGRHSHQQPYRRKLIVVMVTA